MGSLGKLSIVAVALLVVAGCASSSGVSAVHSPAASAGSAVAGPPTIARMMSQIPYEGADQPEVFFGDETRMTAVDGGSGSVGPFSDLIWTTDSLVLADSAQLGIDLHTVTYGVTASIPAQQTATMLWGKFDASTIEARLAGLGFKRQGGVWTYGTDFTLNALGPANLMNDVVFDVSAERLVFGSAVAPVEALAAEPSTPLSSLAEQAALAQCLGSAQGGEIGVLPSANAQQRVPAAMGVEATSTSDETDEVCVAAPSEAAAAAIQSRWVQRIETGTWAYQHAGWSEYFADPTATLVSSTWHIVRLTVKPAAQSPIAAAFFAMYTGDYAPSLIDE
jgi:hypothetical protein